MLDPSPVVGIPEIAANLGVARSTVDSWRQRSLLPKPDMVVGGRPAWWWTSVEQWAKDTHRWPEPKVH